MKKIPGFCKTAFILFFFSLPIFFATSCTPETDPPEKLSAYITLYNFLADTNSVIWTIDGITAPIEMGYSDVAPGALHLEDSIQDVSIIVRSALNGRFLVNRHVSLYTGETYRFVLLGSMDFPVFQVLTDNTSRPASGKIRIQYLQGTTLQNTVDIYMGGSGTEQKLVSALDYSEYSESFEIDDDFFRDSILVTKASDIFQEENLLVNFQDENFFLTHASYFSVFAPATPDAADAPFKLWFQQLSIDQ